MARKLNGKQIYQLFLSALIILLAVLICSSAVGIYQEGSRRKAEDPLGSVYTKEAVEDAVSSIAPLFIAVAVLAGGGMLAGVRSDRRVKKTGGPQGTPGTEPSDEGSPARIEMAADTAAGGKTRSRVILRVLLISAAVLCIIVGIFNGSMQDVFVKAANICSECIGLG